MPGVGSSAAQRSFDSTTFPPEKIPLISPATGLEGGAYSAGQTPDHGLSANPPPGRDNTAMTSRPTSGRGGSFSPAAPAAGFVGASTQPGDRRGSSLPDDEGLSGCRSSQAWEEINQRGSLQDILARRGGGGSDTDSQKQLSEYRARIAREMEFRGFAGQSPLSLSAASKRVSPIQEEVAMSPTATSSSGPTANSAQYRNTVRGDMTTPGMVARTPSYPFPRMTTTTPGATQPPSHRPFTNMSPLGGPPTSHQSPMEGVSLPDWLLSNPATPASAMAFRPGAGMSHVGEHPDFPSPNLYDLSLMLSAEPGLDAWWATVVQIMTDVYRAERVTLAAPADATDIKNVPWGQKATYNATQGDDLSLGYIAKSGGAVPSSTDDAASDLAPHAGEGPRSKGPARPGLQSRHSFTTFEDEKEKSSPTERATTAQLRRPNGLSRSKSYLPATRLRRGSFGDASSQTPLNERALEEHDAAEPPRQLVPSWEAPLLAQQEDNRSRVLPVLQALDYEADPLIDHNGILRVVERGRVIALTRSYPYLNASPGDKSAQPRPAERSAAKKPRPETTTKLSSILGGASLSKTAHLSANGPSADSRKSAGLSAGLTQQDDGRPPAPRYEEYEQTPPSPWSQSPAPSPAIRSDPKENPFFTDAMVDEDSFNPNTSQQQDYSTMAQPETIGVDNSWTVLHIPLTHILLSNPVTNGFTLDSSFALGQRSRGGNGNDSKDAETGTGNVGRQSSPEPVNKPRSTPIAILSILSPVIPYPSSLRHSLELLAPHLATSFSLCRHYTNLEAELAGLQRRRPHTAGFGAVAPDGRQLMDPVALESLMHPPADELRSQPSVTGSITSPSEHSAPSRSSLVVSPSGTPGWDPGPLGAVFDKRSSSTTSPAQQVTGEGYFSSKPRSSHSRVEIIPSTPGMRRAGKRISQESLTEKRSSLHGPPGSKAQPQGSGILSPDPAEPVDAAHHQGAPSWGGGSEETSSTGLQQRRGPSREQPPDSTSSDRKDDRGDENADVPRRPPRPAHRHTRLHSYGGDFATTFQSLLPPSTAVAAKPRAAVPPRSTPLPAAAAAADMPPPSDRLRSLILDTIPVHVFVALPQSGEIVWVNSRFLSYRGQTAGDLARDPWGTIHPSDRGQYLKEWSRSLRTGDQFESQIRIRRFDGEFRWFVARAVASRDKRNVVVQWLGSYMDMHDKHEAEVEALRKQENEASETRHQLLANLIPQIIFTATEDEGITFANGQWPAYAGQSLNDALGLGFMDFVHPDDLARCRIPMEKPRLVSPKDTSLNRRPSYGRSPPPKKESSGAAPRKSSRAERSLRGVHQALSRHNSSSSDSVYELPISDLTELARKGVIKVSTDGNGRLSYTTEVRLRSKTGEYRWHLIRCVEIETVDFGSGPVSFFGSATDINDHKLLEARLKEAMESKGRFLSNMSHEIRTPLIGISGMVSFLQDTTLNEEQRDYTNTIQTSANSLLMIINDILDLSKVDAGMMKLNFEWFHTRSLIEDVNELVSTMAIAKRLELNYIVEEDVPSWVKGDKVRIRQVLLNVIGNAIKFTPEGEVFSRCKVSSRPPEASGPQHDDNEIMLEFAIIDTGRGFTKQEAELIFKPFSQIDGSSTRQHGGSGLGLVISRQLVELHGGKMEGTAVPGQGSTFTFSARFGLPTEDDHPDAPMSPREAPSSRVMPEDVTTHPTFQQFAFQYNRPSRPTPVIISPSINDPPPSSLLSPPALPSSGGGSSSDPSLVARGSVVVTTRATERSSMSSSSMSAAGLVRFSEAARASGADLSQMKLEIPSRRSSPGTTTPTAAAADHHVDFRPPMYSILIICPQIHSREATTKHIKMTLPKDVPHQITPVGSVQEAQRLISGEDAVVFTHIVVNLPSSEEIINLMDQLKDSRMIEKTNVLILSDSVQRQAVSKLTANTHHEGLLSETRVTYIYKPVKPSRFAVIFDPAKERDLSIDRNRSTAQRLVENQKQSYLEVEKRMGNKGYRVLLVEDNPVNQKVLRKYLRKVGVDVDVAADGVECTDRVFEHPHDFYSLILCDLHMPRKDGYQACREVREWEVTNHYPRMPIIALSANVMSDVQDKCLAAGFSDYVTKPVDFIELSTALSTYF